MSKIEIPIPKTQQEALVALADLDGKKWGEAEREYVLKSRKNMSYGLLLTKLAHRPEYNYGDDVPHLVRAAKQALTTDDYIVLRQGG